MDSSSGTSLSTTVLKSTKFSQQYALRATAPLLVTKVMDTIFALAKAMKTPASPQQLLGHAKKHQLIFPRPPWKWADSWLANLTDVWTVSCFICTAIYLSSEPDDLPSPGFVSVF